MAGHFLTESEEDFLWANHQFACPKCGVALERSRPSLADPAGVVKCACKSCGAMFADIPLQSEVRSA
jgi:transcription elongation factor Elf1